MKKGFTLIEMVVVISIAVLILSLGYFNYHRQERKEGVFLEARRLASVLKQAQSLALSGQNFTGTRPLGYGVYLEEGSEQVYLFFATNNDYLYDSDMGEEIFRYSLSPSVRFISFVARHQVFALPSANLYLNNEACSENQEIILQDIRTNEQKKVKINCYSGQIEVSEVSD